MIVVPADFPETWLVFVDESDVRDVLGALPIVEVRYDHTNGSAIGERNRFPIDMSRNERRILAEFVQYTVRRIPIIGTLEYDMLRARKRFHEREYFPEIDSSERLI